MLADLDSLLTALYVLVDDLLPARTGAGRRPKITDAELITLAVAQILLDCHSERRFLRFARQRLGHLFPYIPKQPGYNKRLRALAPSICLVISTLARISPSFCDRLRLLDSTPVPCGASRRDRQALRAGRLGYLRILRQPFALLLGAAAVPAVRPRRDAGQLRLAPANEPEREVAAAMLERARREGLLTGGEVIVADKGFAGEEFEQTVASLDASSSAPTAKTRSRASANSAVSASGSSRSMTPPRASSPSSTTAGHIPEGVWVRVCQRVLALAASVWHNWLLWEAGRTDAPGRHLTAYDH